MCQIISVTQTFKLGGDRLVNTCIFTILKGVQKFRPFNTRAWLILVEEEQAKA